MLTGDMGRFLASLPVVMTCSLVFLALGGFFASQLKTQFTPKDLSYLSYIDVWLPEDAPLSATREVADRAEAITRRVIDEYGKAHAEEGKPLDLLESLTTFVGGGGPRFWFSVSPEPQQTNYAQIIVQLKDKHVTHHLVEPLQAAFSAEIPGARADMRQLETSAIGIPVAIRISGEDIPTLRAEAEKVKNIFRAIPLADRVQDNWGAESFLVNLEINSDRANLVGVTNFDVAVSSAMGMNGYQVGELREGDKQIPVIARMRMEERSQLADLQNLYVYSIAMIFMALVVQFKNAVKPLLVFAAIPYGIVGALAALWIMGMPFGFMGFLGIASLVVIVSHVIVFFDFIEEAHERGESLIESLLDAGIMRLRPVMITVGATVFALFPLASHGGPLWEPLCYAQIGGLTVATFITLLLVPVLYAIFVLDLKIVKWEKKGEMKQVD